MKKCEKQSCQNCIADILAYFFGTLGILYVAYIVYVFIMSFFSEKNIDNVLNISFNLGDSFWGAVIGGTITLFVMYSTNSSGRKNVDKTINNNKELDEQKTIKEIEHYKKQLLILLERQKIDIEEGRMAWDKMSVPLASRFTVIPLGELLNILGKIPELPRDDALAILDFANIVSLLDKQREDFCESLDDLNIEKKLDSNAVRQSIKKEVRVSGNLMAKRAELKLYQYPVILKNAEDLLDSSINRIIEYLET